MTFFYDGFISCEEYEKIKFLDGSTEICFGEISKHCKAECYLSEIVFITDADKINKRIENNKSNYFDLMDYLYDQEIIHIE